MPGRQSVWAKMLLAGPCARPEELERQHAAGQYAGEREDQGRSPLGQAGAEAAGRRLTVSLPQPARQAAALIATLADAIHVATAFANLELVTQLDAIRMRRSVLRDKNYALDTAQADRDYEGAFRAG